MRKTQSRRGKPAAQKGKMPAILKIARNYVRAGFSIVPIRPDASKAPGVDTWKGFQRELPTEEQLKTWFGNGSLMGLGIITGQGSGDLLVLDFDEPTVFEPWKAFVEKLSPGLIKRLPTVKTPSGGYHVYLRGAGQIGAESKTTKLACRSSDKLARTTLIETKGEGGYVLAPGSPATCHSAGVEYEHYAGPRITQTPRLSSGEISILLEAARSFNRVPERTVEHKRAGKPGRRIGNQPGDRFNREANWEDILVPAGWTLVSTDGAKMDWRRPGKSEGASATTGYCSNEQRGELLYVFSTNAQPFEGDRAYSKFAAWTFLMHDGDFGKAAKALRNGKPGTELLKVPGGTVGGPVPKLEPEPEAEKCDQIPDGCTLQQGMEVFRRWLYIADEDLLEVVLGVVACNHLPGDPLWMMIVDAAASGKTEFLRLLLDHPDVISVSTLTPASLISGFQDDKDHSLLPKLAGKILMIKDFTAILSMNHDRRAEIFGQLRDVYDGQASKAFGVGEIKEYRSRFNVIAACTPAIEQHAGAFQPLGERFLRYQPVSGDPKRKIARALQHSHQEPEMRKMLAETAQAILQQAAKQLPRHSEKIGQLLVELADFLAVARTEVPRSGYTKEVQYVAVPEVGSRVAKQLLRLMQGVAMLNRHSEIGRHEFRIAQKVAFASLPSKRRGIIEVLFEHGQNGESQPLGDLAKTLRLPEATLRLALEDLNLLRIVEKVKSSTGQGQKLQEQHRLTDEFQEALRRIAEFVGPGGGDF